MRMNQLSKAIMALGRGVYSVLSTARDVNVRDTSILI